MGRHGLCISLATFLAALWPPAAAQAASWLKTGPETSRPIGHVEYCAKFPAQCRRYKISSTLAPSRIQVLQGVNSSVNRAIKPVSDIRQFGKREYWTSNTKAGDCEDYALAKKAALVKRGFRPSDLLLTMAYNGPEAHTVLIARTRDGDFVLDNLEDRVLPVSASRLSFTKIQARADGARWMRVTGRTATAP